MGRRSGATLLEALSSYAVYVAIVAVGLSIVLTAVSAGRRETMGLQLQGVHDAVRLLGADSWGYGAVGPERLAASGLLPANMVTGNRLALQTEAGWLRLVACGDQGCPLGGTVAATASGALGFRTGPLRPARPEMPRASFGFSFWVQDVNEVAACVSLVEWRPSRWPDRVGVQVQGVAGGRVVMAPSPVIEPAFPPVTGCGGINAVGWSVLNSGGVGALPWRLDVGAGGVVEGIRELERGDILDVCQCMLETYGVVTVGMGFRNL